MWTSLHSIIFCWKICSLKLTCKANMQWGWISVLCDRTEPEWPTCNQVAGCSSWRIVPCLGLRHFSLLLADEAAESKVSLSEEKCVLAEATNSILITMDTFLLSVERYRGLGEDADWIHRAHHCVPGSWEPPRPWVPLDEYPQESVVGGQPRIVLPTGSASRHSYPCAMPSHWAPAGLKVLLPGNEMCSHATEVTRDCLAPPALTVRATCHVLRGGSWPAAHVRDWGFQIQKLTFAHSHFLWR